MPASTRTRRRSETSDTPPLSVVGGRTHARGFAMPPEHAHSTRSRTTCSVARIGDGRPAWADRTKRREHEHAFLGGGGGGGIRTLERPVTSNGFRDRLKVAALQDFCLSSPVG